MYCLRKSQKLTMVSIKRVMQISCFSFGMQMPHSVYANIYEEDLKI